MSGSVTVSNKARDSTARRRELGLTDYSANVAKVGIDGKDVDLGSSDSRMPRVSQGPPSGWVRCYGACLKGKRKSFSMALRASAAAESVRCR